MNSTTGAGRKFLAACLLAAVTVGAIPVQAQQGAPNGEWPHWGGDLGNSKYSPLDQIRADNVAELEIAWRWKSANFGPRPDFNYEATPVKVGNRLYTTAGSRRAVVAIDPGTGETLWMYRLDEGRRADVAPRRNSGRGVAYWTDGNGDERILWITIGYQLVALDAKTGLPIPEFGNGGIVDLLEDFDQPRPADGTIGSTSPPVIVGDVAVVGAALLAGSAPRSKANTKGHVRGYDVRTGRRIWIFHTIPEPGEFGNDTWKDGSWEYTGNTAVWPPFSADEELEYVYLPVEVPTGDFYGGHRPGDNLFANSLVCLNVRTGERVWHYQLIHHDIWDWDTGSPPNLIDIAVDGVAIKAVAQATKQGFLYVFDRVTGRPVWPIEERPVAAGDVPGEWYSPTQPFPTKPAPFDRQGISEADLIDFTPELKAEALEIMRRFKTGPLYTPPIVGGKNGLLGTLVVPGAQGAALWQGASWDPETGVLYVPSVTNMSVIALQPGGSRSDMAYIGGGAGTSDLPRGPWGIGPRGLPLVKPPYGRITAIDMNTGEHVWQVANGETYDWMKTHEALQGLDIPRTGRADEGGIVVTKTLLFAGQGCGLFRAGGGGGPMFYALDKQTGDIVHQIELPASTCGNPMTYMHNGKQYIVVAIGARGFPGELVALTLP